MMDTLISGFADDHRLRQLTGSEGNNDQLLDHPLATTTGSFTNKLSKFTLATFDDEGKNKHEEKQEYKMIVSFYLYLKIIPGRCIGQMGSWSFQ